MSVNLDPTMWVATGGQLFLVRGKGSLWSQVSHRKLKFSIWAASILGDTAKDPRLISHDYHKCWIVNNFILAIILPQFEIYDSKSDWMP